MPKSLDGARARASVLVTLVLIAAASGCGGSSNNGVASKSADEILAASRTAAQGATAVHVTSHNAQGPLTVTSDVEVAANSGRAKISLLALGFEVIRVGDTLYLKGNAAFDKHLSTTFAHVPTGAWIKAPANTGELAQFADFTNLQSELERTLSNGGTLTKGSTSATLNGQRAVELTQTTKLSSGAIFIATTGEPYPLQIIKHGKETGHTSFTDWNQPLNLTAPTDTISVQQLQAAGH